MSYYSKVSYTGDGSTATFSVPFPYLDKAHVSVLVDGVAATISSWPSSSTVTLSSPPANVVQIVRTTPRTSPLVSWSTPVAVKASDLNRIVKQLLYVAQEALDGIADSLSLTWAGVWDARSKRVTNVATPTSANDASNKAYADGIGTTAQAYADAVGVAVGASSSAADAIQQSQLDALSFFALQYAPGTQYDAKGLRITNGADPIASTDFATKGYVSTAAAAAALSVTGGGSGIVITPAMTGGSLQAAINAAYLIGADVDGMNALYTLSSALAMKPDVIVRKAKIKQADGVNLATLIDFDTNSAHRSALLECEVDGNRTNNAFSQSNKLINTGSADDVRIQRCYIHDGPGNGIIHYQGKRPIISDNRIDFIANITIACSAGGSAALIEGWVINNRITRSAQHTIAVWSCQEMVVFGNKIDAVLRTGMLFDFNGTLATWKSGTACTDLLPGMFLVANSGAEYFIVAKPTATTFTLQSAAPVLTNTATIGGSGDVISIESSSHVLVQSNRISAGVTGGVIISDLISGVPLNNVRVYDNDIDRCGESGIATLGTLTSLDIVRNRIVDVALAGAATPSTYKDGIAIGGTVSKCVLDGNVVTDTGGNMQYAYAVPAVPGGVMVGRNVGRGAAQAGIRNGATVALVGWGTTASATVVSTGSEIKITVTSAGTGQTASPSLTITTNATKMPNDPMWLGAQIGGTGARQLLGLFAETDTQTIWTWDGTPIDTKTYVFVFK